MATGTESTPVSMSVAVGPSASDSPVSYFKVSTTAASLDIQAGVAGKKIRVLSFFLVEDTGGTAETIKFQSNASTDLTGAMKPTAGVPLQANWCPHGHFETNSGEKLNIAKGASTIQLSGWVTYQLVDGTND